MSDFILYHYPLCPFSRKVRFFLDELGIKYTKKEVRPWKREESFLKLNPTGETPILFEKKNNYPIVDSYIITDFLDIEYNKTLFKYQGDDELEMKRLHMWFDKKFYREVSKKILDERVYNTFTSIEINTDRLRGARENLQVHLKYISYLLKNYEWLVGSSFSLADIAAATQLSSLDYLGEISWKKYPRVKTWYSVIKSKPSFSSILSDNITIIPPSKKYTDVDFD